MQTMHPFRNILLFIVLLLNSNVSFSWDKTMRITASDFKYNIHTSFTLFDTSKVNITDTVKLIASYQRVQGKVAGFGAINSPQYLRYVWLSEKASTPKLLELLNHSNSVVRVYAFWALKARNYVDIKNVVLDHIGDTLNFFLQEGCDGYYLHINLYFLKLSRNLFTDVEFKKYLALISKYYNKQDWKFIILHHRDV